LPRIGGKASFVCAGFLLKNSVHNLGTRISLMRDDVNIDLVKDPGEGILFDSYREMAEANGVPNDDPILARCRSNKL
jgi:hypothetical protein